MQETIQGFRVIKAFNSGRMRRRLATASARRARSNKLARVANRARPLMEVLGGFAIGLGLYAGYA